MIDTTQFAAANQASADAFFSLSDKALQGVEQFVALNLQAIKTSLAEYSEATQAALQAKGPEDLVKLQAATLQTAPQNMAAYGRQVNEIFTSVATAQRAAFEAQIADLQAKFLDAVNGALRNAPGSENAIMLVKSAVAAANNAYEGVNKASKQVTDAVAANVAKVTEVTETAVKTARNTRSTIEA